LRAYIAEAPKGLRGIEVVHVDPSLAAPPVRTSISQESSVRPIDFGTHHCLNNSGRVHASNTMGCRAVECSCDHELTLGLPLGRRTVLHEVSSLSLPASIGLFPSFQFLDNVLFSVGPYPHWLRGGGAGSALSRNRRATSASASAFCCCGARAQVETALRTARSRCRAERSCRCRCRCRVMRRGQTGRQGCR
jgi:hypothetical protein